MLPVYVPKSLFSPSVYELSHSASYEDGVKSHKLGEEGGASAGFGRILASYRSSYSSKKQNLVRLGCEKNENARLGGDNPEERGKLPPARSERRARLPFTPARLHL